MPTPTQNYSYQPQGNQSFSLAQLQNPGSNPQQQDQVGYAVRNALQSNWNSNTLGTVDWGISGNLNTHLQGFGNYLQGKSSGNTALDSVYENTKNQLTGAGASTNGTQIGGGTGTGPNALNTGNNPANPANTSTAIPAAPSASGTQPNAIGGSIYTVKPGDTLSQIAQSQGMSLQQLLASNPSIANPNLIKAGQQINLGAKYKQGLATAQASGQDSPTTAGAASAAVQSNLPAQSAPQADYSNIYANDPGMQQLVADHTAFMNSQNQQASLADTYKKLTQDAGLPALDTQLINMKNVIDGTEDDIRNEVTKAAGFATNSQVLALTDARNKVMIQNYNNLLQTKQNAVDNINNMMELTKEDRANAVQQFNTQMDFDQKMVDYSQKMQSNAQSSLNNIISSVGYGGLLSSALSSGDPTAVSRIESTLGLSAGGLQGLAAAETAKIKAEASQKSADAFNSAYEGALGKAKGEAAADNSPSDSSSSQYTIQNGDTYNQIAAKNGTTVDALRQANPNLDENNLKVGQNINLNTQTGGFGAYNGSSAKAQDALEQQYRQTLVKEVQSRSGTLGTEDAKVAQANHLASLMNQYYDPNTGNYNVPKAQYGELVLGLAGMLSKTGTPTDSQTANINTATAKGDLNKALTYATGSPTNGSTQAVIKNLADSITRQANTAVSNRTAAVRLLEGLAPTGLDPRRKAALEQNTLVPYSGIKSGIQNTSAPLKTGDSGTFSSGVTWKITN